MRWKTKVVNPEKGKIEVVKSFLWFPLRIGDETRWFETASYEKIWRVDSEGNGKWALRKWIDQ